MHIYICILYYIYMYIILYICILYIIYICAYTMRKHLIHQVTLGRNSIIWVLWNMPCPASMSSRPMESDHVRMVQTVTEVMSKGSVADCPTFPATRKLSGKTKHGDPKAMEIPLPAAPKKNIRGSQLQMLQVHMVHQ
jgi:hypothetical protein